MGPSFVASQSRYAECVNPQWVRLLDLLGMNARYQRCEGCELFAEDGKNCAGMAQKSRAPRVPSTS